MLNVCTIIACNYLPFARVLIDSFFSHHPDGRFTLLLVDDEDRRFDTSDARVDWRRLADIGLDQREVRRLAGIYDVTELATAVKPVLLRTLLDEGHDPVVYLDPDIRIHASLQPVADLAAEHGVVLTPHTMQPYPRDDRQVDGFFILAAGVYNLGFIAVGGRARPFLDWWWGSTRREALIDVARMMFTDQRWVDFVPSLFDPFILKDPGYNVAYWNLHGRALTADGDGYQVNGLPLRFFHFSGYDYRQPWLLSKHQGDRPRVLLSERPALRRICDDYRTALLAAGIDAGPRRSYGWDRLPSGLAMTSRMRRLYWSGLVNAEERQTPEPPDPWDGGQPDAFIAWLNSPEEGAPRRVSRYLYSIWRDRLDLQIHFPDIAGGGAAPFNDWIRTDGVTQADIPLELLPPPAPLSLSAAAPSDLTEGVTVAGYFRAELGIGEAARLLVGAVEAAGLPHATTTYDATLNRQAHEFADRPEAGAAFDVNVLCVNADMTPRFARDMGPAFFAGRHNVGYWFWEIEEFPDAMRPAFEVVDEVWTATDFVAEAIRQVGVRPVFTVPVPVPVPRLAEDLDRTTLELPEGFLFLLSFDFLSIMERKNPLGVAEAYMKAFAPGTGPTLILKCINGHLRLPQLERLRAAVAGRPDIRIVDRYYSARERDALVQLCDCYVSLHRSEGLGLTMAEAMAVGKPVIATGYSGNLHFMTPDNSFLVDYVKVPVPRGCDPYPTTASWAEPDLDDAARLMRQVYERPAEAAARGARGRADVLEKHSVHASGAAVAQRLAAIRDERRARIVLGGVSLSAAEPASTGDRLQELHDLLPHLDQLATPKVSVDGRAFAGARTAAQRAFFRVMRPYWFQQRQFHTELIGTLARMVRLFGSEASARAALQTQLRTLTEQFIELRRGGQASALDLERQLAELRRAAAVTTGTVKASEQRVAKVSDDARQQAEQWSTTFADLQRATGDFQRNAAAHLSGLTEHVGQSERGLAELEERLFAVPYMSDPQLLLERDDAGRERLGFSSAGDAREVDDYRAFEAMFRGPEALIRERQQVYVPLLHGHPPVADLGCGRGEMLDLLREAGIEATGVDGDRGMVERCRAKGHDVVEADLIDWLRSRPAASLGAIFSAQVIEHLGYDALRECLTLARHRLRPGGLLIAETVNPHALEAFKTFHTDLTHQHPIFPEVALALVRQAGFARAHVLFPTGSGELRADRRTCGEYAVIATSPNGG